MHQAEYISDDYSNILVLCAATAAEKNTSVHARKVRTLTRSLLKLNSVLKGEHGSWMLSISLMRRNIFVNYFIS